MNSSFCRKDFTESGIKWRGEEGTRDFCKYPKLIMEKAKINRSELIEKVTIFRDNDFKYTIKHNQSHWKSSTDNYFGSCYTFITPQIQTERKKPLQRIGFYMKRSASWMVHSPGTFKAIKGKALSKYNKFGLSNHRYTLDYKVYHLLDYNNQPCQKDHEYQKDQCYDSSVFEESMKLVNCTVPNLENQSYICTDQESAEVARMIDQSYSNGLKESKCLNPCTYIKASTTLMSESKVDRNAITIVFPESVEVLSAYYAYDQLSLIAEVGGYVGLFLGWSVYQLNFIFDISTDSFKKKMSAMKSLMK